jgi:RNA polymerase primary sigma factor
MKAQSKYTIRDSDAGRAGVIMSNGHHAVRRPGRKQREVRYAQGFQKDDIEDRSSFIESHLPLVISIAKRKANEGVDFDDLVQEGILGLITAADKFDPGRGFRFSTYATWWIRQAIDDAVLKHGDTVKKPSNYASHLKVLLKASRDLAKKLDREPTVDEVSKNAEMDPSMVRQLLSLIPGTISLDAPISDIDDSSNNYMDVLEDRSTESPDETSITGQMRDDIVGALEELTEKERQIIEMRFGLKSGEGRSLREVGKIFNLSPERIRQIEEGAIVKLRKSGSSRVLKEYLN